MLKQTTRKGTMEKTMLIRMPEKVHRAIKKKAAVEGRTMHEIAVEALTKASKEKRKG